MITPTYEQQWKKLTTAYLRNGIQPYKTDFCFCGNLCNNETGWFSFVGQQQSIETEKPAIHHSFGIYTGLELGRMEHALLLAIHKSCETFNVYDDDCYVGGKFIAIEQHPNYEQAVFEGMTAALEVLRQIHEAKGDPTAKPITLNKRQLA